MKRFFLIIPTICLCFCSCREHSDVYFNPNDATTLTYSTYTDQFIAIWQGLNTHYVFWSDDPTPWYDTYTRMLPQFQALDSAYAANGEPADSAAFIHLYADATQHMIDHHLVLTWRDVHSGKAYSFSPGQQEVLNRPYTQATSYHTDSLTNAITQAVSSGLLATGRWGEYKGERNFYSLHELPNGRYIAYLWQSAFMMNTALNMTPSDEKEAQFKKNIQRWLDLCTTDTLLAGIILDNRNNRGGYVSDLNLIVGPFISEPLQYATARYKEGPAKYEYTDWFPLSIDTSTTLPQRDLLSEHIPYVVLTNAMSISMAESSAQAISMLPTGHTIGERTFGGHGQLVTLPSILHDGTFGAIDGLHYVYTSSAQVQFTQCPLLEGIGITPQQVILQHEVGYNGVLQAAIDYITQYE